MNQPAMPRRAVLQTTGLGVLGAVGLAARPSLCAAAEPSSRIHLQLPASFSNGYSVPMTLSVDSPMTETDYVRRVHVLAPLNPIVPVATFNFTPQSGRAIVSTRIRLAEPQFVVAVAELSDGTRLKTQTWVKVDTNGCT